MTKDKIQLLEITKGLIQERLENEVHNTEYTDEVHRLNIQLVNELQDIDEEIRILRAIPEVGKYANHSMFSDTEPYEIIRVVSDKTLEIRSMNCENVTPKDTLKFHVGGFAGNCSNQDEQQWKITSNPDGYVMRIRKRKDGTWGNGHRNFYISDKACKFYDYNF